MKIRRLVALILSVLLVISGMPAVLADEVPAAAETVENEALAAGANVTVLMEGDCGAQGGNAHFALTYSGDRKDILTLTVTGTGDMKNYETCDEIEKRTPWYNQYEEDIWHVVIGDGITSVGDNTCLRCSNLLDVKLPDSVTVIGEEAFSGCYSLTEINIPPRLISIGSGAFRGCPLYNTLVFPETLRSIGSFAFQTCHEPRYITFPKSLTDFGENCFTGTAWVNAQQGCVVVNGVLLDYSMFGRTQDNAEVTIPNTVTTIVPGALLSNTALTTVTIPETVTKIGDHAFGLPGKKITIRGLAGSAAEAYAKEYGFPFVPVTAVAGTPTPTPTAAPTPTPTPQPTATVKPTPTPTATPAPKLTAPKLSSVKNTSSGIQFTWQKVSGAEKYRVYFKTGNGGWKKIGDTTKTTYTRKDSKLKAGTKYTFTVKAVKGNTTSSYDTKGLAVTYVKQSNVSKVENTTTGVKITWKKSSGAEKYTLYYKTTGGWKKIGTTEKTSYTWKKAKSGTKYTFTVKAIGKDGSAASYNNGKSITYLAAPAKLAVAKSGSTGIQVSWGKVTGAAKYRVYYKTTGGWKKLKDVTGTSYTWTKGKKGTKYAFTVRAIAKDGKTMSAYDTKGKALKL